MIMEAEFESRAHIELCRDATFSFLIEFMERLNKSKKNIWEIGWSNTEDKMLGTFISNLRASFTSLDLYSRRISQDGKQSEFPKTVNNLMKELDDAIQTSKILTDKNIFALHTQYTRLPKNVSNLKQTMQKVREKLKKEMENLGLNKQVILCDLERWRFELQHTDFAEIDRNYHSFISKVIRTCIRNNLF
jgi:hypothetical protein